jgi:hypothetical protein
MTVTRVHAVQTSVDPRSPVNVGLYFKETRHVPEHNSVTVVVSMDIVAQAMDTARVRTVILDLVLNELASIQWIWPP